MKGLSNAAGFVKGIFGKKNKKEEKVEDSSKVQEVPLIENTEFEMQDPNAKETEGKQE